LTVDEIHVIQLGLIDFKNTEEEWYGRNGKHDEQIRQRIEFSKSAYRKMGAAHEQWYADSGVLSGQGEHSVPVPESGESGSGVPDQGLAGTGDNGYG